jgi:hypothetical protein
MTDLEGPQSLALELPTAYGLGVRCTIGIEFIVPVTVRAHNITELTLKVAVSGHSIIPVSESLNFSPAPGKEEVVVEVELLSVRASAKKEWVSIEVTGGRMYQAVGFLIEVSESFGPTPEYQVN